MMAFHSSAPPRPLGDAWRDWTEIVRLFADKHPTREQIAEADYRRIYQEITAALHHQSNTDAADESRDLAELCDRLGVLIRPWITLTALRETDARFTQNLLQQCQAKQIEIDHQIGGSPAVTCLATASVKSEHEDSLQSVEKSSAWRTIVVFVLLFVGMFVMVLSPEFWSTVSSNSAQPGTDQSSDGLRSLWQEMQRAESHIRFWLITGLAAIVTTVTAWAVFRPPRSY